MKDTIQLLPDSIANQIAAGEVVQRPASVVKELMENAVDAQSKKIMVMVKEAGKTLIQVVDDGIGMSGTDARMSFERHATSKLRTAEDLFAIRTMGFRGEALASIAAIAQVELKTRRNADELGHFLCVEGSTVKKQELASVPQGTSVSVKNIFFNVPARRNFLKSNPVEMRHIIDEFQRVALANPGIALTLYQDGTEIYHLKPTKLGQRIVNIYGKGHQNQLVPCGEETTLLKVRGYIGKPEHARKTRGGQYFFVNQRFIKSSYLNHAVVSAYEGLLPDRYFPFYALFIQIDPKHVDVNVHPTKTEIKFDDERTVYGIIRAAVKQALGAHNITPSLDFESDVNFEAIMNVKGSKSLSQGERDYGQMKNLGLQRSQIEHWEQLYQHSVDESRIKLEGEEQTEPSTRTLGSAVNSRFEAASSKNAIIQVHQKYLVTSVKSGLMLIHYQAALERILYEKYLDCLKRRKGSSQQLLFPQSLNLSAADFNLIMDLRQEIEALGFAFEEFGKTDLVVKGIPVDAVNHDIRTLFEGLVEQIKNSSSELGSDRHEQLARSMAKRLAVFPEKTLEPVEMAAFVDQLFGCNNPNYAPDGRKTHMIMESSYIESLL